MTEYRIRCSGQGKPHDLHVYRRDQKDLVWHREYLDRQKWTEIMECQPHVIESREVGEWVRMATE